MDNIVLFEFDTPPMGGQMDPTGFADGGISPSDYDQAQSAEDPINNIPQDNNDDIPSDDATDISQDPESPELPEIEEYENFDLWRNEFFKQSIRGSVGDLIDMINSIRDNDYDAYQRKFIEDNLQILFLRQNANIDKAQKEIRNNIRKNIDKANPGVSIVNHLFITLQSMPELNNCFIKLNNLLGMKGDLHRKFIAALLGAIQVGSGSATEDIVIEEKDYSIPISTRFNSQFGEINLGKWSLKEDDPERYLSDPELKRLEDGSPEEREVLRRRIVIESIAEYFNTRAFIINIVHNDGTIYTIGWDLGTSLKTAYMDGKVVVRNNISDNSEVMIDESGDIIPLVDLDIKFVRDSGEVDINSKPKKEEVTFIQRRDGMLFLKCGLSIIKQISNNLNGFNFKELPYNGNPADLKVISRCIPSTQEILMRNC